MSKKIIAGLFALAVMATGASAAEVNFDQLSGSVVKNVLSTDKYVSSVPMARQGRYYGRSRGANGTWTIMVYINGKNNLEEFALKDLNEMEMVGSNDRVKVVAELGRIAGESDAEGDWTTTRRYLVQKDDNPNQITSPVVQELQRTDMGDYRHLIDFAKWAKANYPADNYMLVVWNHGAGWVRGRGMTTLTKGISYDDETGNHINTPQLGQALKEIGGVNVYGSDACLMQMAEVDFEIAPYVQYIVGSEETEPGDGWTYNTFLGKLAQEPNLTARNVAMHAVDAYGEHYASIQEPATQSAVDTAALPEFGRLLDAWTDAVYAANIPAIIKSARQQTQKYAYADNKSLAHFVYLVGKATSNADVKAKGNALISFIQNTLVIDNKTFRYDNSRGIAVYLPNWKFSPDYATLQFSKISKWGQFAKWTSTIK